MRPRQGAVPLRVRSIFSFGDVSKHQDDSRRKGVALGFIPPLVSGVVKLGRDRRLLEAKFIPTKRALPSSLTTASSMPSRTTIKSCGSKELFMASEAL